MFKYSEKDYSERLGFLVNTYYQAEAEFIRVMEYIPLNNVWKTFSYKLLFLLSTTIPAIEEGLRLLMFSPYSNDSQLKDFERQINEKRGENKRLDFNNVNSINFLNMREVLEYHNKISNEKLSNEDISFANKILTPFKVRKYAPAWYEDIGSIKHSMFEGLELANIENSINALSALYLLCAILRREMEVKKGSWFASNKEYVTIVGQGEPFIIRSKLFPTIMYK